MWGGLFVVDPLSHVAPQPQQQQALQMVYQALTCN
jgi:hypothetical protein